MDPLRYAGSPGSAPEPIATPVDPSTDPITISEQQGAARSQPAFVDVFQQLINGLPEQIALLDEHWTILAVNHAWTKTAALYG